jgi:hypothetical protein
MLGDVNRVEARSASRAPAVRSISGRPNIGCSLDDRFGKTA